MEEKRRRELQNFLNSWGIIALNMEIFNVALTHPTFAFEHREDHIEHNQRLEFLGDAVLDLIVGEYLYQRYPVLPEGELTKMRASIVCETVLAKTALNIGLNKYLRLGKGERISGGDKRVSILADVFEAVVGAIYLEVGLPEVRRFILGTLDKELHELSPGKYGDFKTDLQERIQSKFSENVVYVILEEKGPDHAKRFLAGVTFRGKMLGKGEGKSKKEAEQMAAKEALAKMENRRVF